MLHRFESIVYNRAIVYKRKNFLKVVVHVMTTDRCNQTTSWTKSRERLFIAAVFLSLCRENAVDRALSVKHGLGHLGHL